MPEEVLNTVEEVAPVEETPTEVSDEVQPEVLAEELASEDAPEVKE